MEYYCNKVTFLRKASSKFHVFRGIRLKFHIYPSQLTIFQPGLLNCMLSEL